MPTKKSLGALPKAARSSTVSGCKVIRWSEGPFRKIPQGWRDNRIEWRESQAQGGDKEAWEPTRAATQDQREGSGVRIFRR